MHNSIEIVGLVYGKVTTKAYMERITKTNLPGISAMKTINLFRGHTGPHAVFPAVSKNLQDAQPVNKSTVSVTADLTVADRPHVLTKRSARWARRTAH